ncbi:MAG: response regulator transcription factor [Bacteroidota bacterium]|nr:response regulator transcription factor [Bacteroidota bacterium]
MSRIKLSIVDEHTILREGLCCLLNVTNNLKVVSDFSNGIDFINSLHKIMPDIAIIDIAMPGMDGIQTIKKAREIVPELKILVLSSHTEKQNYVQLHNLKVNGYVLKDSNFEELKHAIAEIVKGRKFFSQQLLLNQLSLSQEKQSEILTELENRILLYISQGYSTQEIAGKLCLSVGTIERYRSKLLLQTGMSNSISLVVYALKNNLIQTE